MGVVLSDIIIIVVLLLLVSGACIYIYREKKCGRRCIGCPMAGSCAKKDLKK